MEKKYTFELTITEGQIVMAGLKKLPMELVENLVTNLDTQFKAQVQADEAKVEAEAIKAA